MRDEPTTFKKNIQWQIRENKYVVRNVPFIVADYDDEELLDLHVSLTLTTLRDLMIDNAIPQDVDYNDFAHIKF